MTDDTAQEAPESPNPIDVIEMALHGATTVDPEIDAIQVYHALLAAPVETRRMLAEALLNTETDDDDTVILVMQRPQALAMDAAQNWWPMQPAPGVAEMVQAAIARESAVLAKGPFMTPAPIPRKLRLV